MQPHKKHSVTLIGYISIALVAAASIGWLLMAQAHYARNMALISGRGLSLDDVRRMSDADIPVGSSKNQIERWFKGKSIRYGYLDASKGQLRYEPLAKRGTLAADKLTGILTAVVPGYSGRMIKCHTYMAFLIDKGGKSVERQVSGACTNPVERLQF